MDNFQQFIVTSKYCRWIEEANRRETWAECVDRYFNYMMKRTGAEFNAKLRAAFSEAKDMVYNREIFPSMRGLMTAGPAADVDDTCLYNCSYVGINRIRAFSDVMYILCCGTGVGFSCESEEINNLPVIPESIERKEGIVIQVPDSRVGWADSFKELLNYLYEGVHPTWDTSLIRPSGARLKTFGGRASGPEPLERLFRYVVNLFNKAKGRKLTSLEVHDIVCLTGEIVIAGAVRRSALISLSDLHDDEMARAKSGPWWETSGHRSLANNSAVYESKPTMSTFLKEWSTIFDSRSGERGICNRESLKWLAGRVGRDTDYRFGTNPCSEIILRPNQFCNLTEIVIRPEDTEETLAKKVKYATFLGTVQSSCTNFTYLDEEWKKNCEEERLLGVSFTGVYDNKLMSGQLGMPKLRWALKNLRDTAQLENYAWAKELGINSSLSITCCKPSGTTSCVAGTASGMHPRYSEFYIRRVRIDVKDPICEFMVEKGFPHEKCTMRPDTTMVFAFPMKSPTESIVQKDLCPIDHLDLWLEYQTTWCDHKPSVTISYSDDKFLAIGDWVWKNWNMVSGISFLPYNDHIYEQAPFEPIDARTFNLMRATMPTDVDWTELSNYETEDNTSQEKTLACSGGSCEVVDLIKE